MDAVIYNGYSGAEGDDQARCSITVERRPIPEVKHERDVIVKGELAEALISCRFEHNSDRLTPLNARQSPRRRSVARTFTFIAALSGLRPASSSATSSSAWSTLLAVKLARPLPLATGS